jgi:hypothetical protein
MRMPRPPPPADAFTITGKPISRASSNLQLRTSSVQDSGKHRQTGFSHRSSRFYLIAHQTNDIRRWTNELDVAGRADFGKGGRLGQNP